MIEVVKKTSKKKNNYSYVELILNDRPFFNIIKEYSNTVNFNIKNSNFSYFSLKQKLTKLIYNNYFLHYIIFNYKSYRRNQFELYRYKKNYNIPKIYSVRRGDINFFKRWL